MNAVATKDLTKRFGPILAVDRLTFTVRRGEIFGLVGPDASGKTTTIRMLCGILRPDDGEAWVAGSDIQKETEAIKGKVGYLPQRFGLYGDLSVLENIHFYADLYEVSRKERRDRIARLLRFANLEPFGKRKARDLSGGMKQKLGLICALIHTPQILFLDEPTTGVDPLSRRDFWVILYELLKDGVTILFSTSYLDEAERCHRIGLIYQGRLLIVDGPEVVRNVVAGTILELRTEDNPRCLSLLESVEGFRSVVLSGDRIHILVDDAETGKKVIRKTLSAGGIGILDLQPVKPSLEDAFVAMVREREEGFGKGSS